MLQVSTTVRRLGGAGATNLMNDAVSYAVAGNNELAIASLEKAWANHMFLLPFINVDPLFDGLRGDLRFIDLIRRSGLAS